MIYTWIDGENKNRRLKNIFEIETNYTVTAQRAKWVNRQLIIEVLS